MTNRAGINKPDRNENLSQYGCSCRPQEHVENENYEPSLWIFLRSPRTLRFRFLSLLNQSQIKQCRDLPPAPPTTGLPLAVDFHADHSAWQNVGVGLIEINFN